MEKSSQAQRKKTVMQKWCKRMAEKNSSLLKALS
jgi:hypothetical protein